MKQEIFTRGGMRIFSESDPRVLYDEQTLRSMTAAGYTVKVDGKKFRGKMPRELEYEEVAQRE